MKIWGRMLSEKERAMLGDREAAKRLTDAGVLVPCCGVQPILHRFEPLNCYGIECGENGQIHNTSFCDSEYEARLAWNTRAPLLTPAQMAVLERETGKVEEGIK